MANNWYVNSAVVGGNNTGSSWVNAAPNLTLAIANSVAGDDIYVINTHSETSSNAVTYGFKGTGASPNRVFCTSSISNAPAQPQDLTSGAQFAATGANGISITGFVYINGCYFSSGSGANSTTFAVASTNNSEVIFENCAINVPSTLSSQIFLKTISGKGTRIILNNTSVSFANTSSSINCYGGNIINWKNTPNAVTGATLPSTLITSIAGTYGGLMIMDSVDLSALGSGKTIIGPTLSSQCYQINNCKLGTSVVVASTPGSPGSFIDLFNSDSNATGYRQERYQFQGNLFTETTNTLIGGASDGVQPISWKVVTTSGSHVQSPFECYEIAQWNSNTGFQKTATVQIISNSTLTNNDVFIECIYSGNASYPSGSFVNSLPATMITANSNLISSAASWNGSATTAQQISVNFTAQLQGIVRIKVKVGKPSLTVWIDPKVTIT